MSKIAVEKGGKLEVAIKKWLADKREIEAELKKGNRAIYTQKGIKLADPLSNPS